MKTILSVLLVFLILACAEDAREMVDLPVTDGNAAIIRNPIASQVTVPTDTSLVAKLTLADAEYAFGKVKAGGVITHEFKFTNSGRVPLLITDARSTCGCTVSEWPRQPIAPGKEGSFRVSFDTAGKTGKQRKPVTLTANTYPSSTTVYVAGEVTE